MPAPHAAPRVLHTAQALVDHVIEVPGLPDRGGNVNASQESRYAGGAVNILVAAARAGAPAAHGGAIGTGPGGDLIRAALRAEGIAATACPIPDQDTGECLVLVEPSAERTFVTTYGAERRITAASLATLCPRPGDLVCLSGYSLFEPTRDPLLEFLDALEPGVEVVLDPGAPFASFPTALRDRVLAATTVFTANADEARALSSTDATSPVDLARSAAEHLRPGAVVIVRDGAAGCAVLAPSAASRAAGTADPAAAPVMVPGFPREAVDTNGAGDAHTGALLGERALGADWVGAARRANAAAAIKVTRRGPATAPTRREVDAFLDAVPVADGTAGA